MAASLDDLRRYVLFRAYERVGSEVGDAAARVDEQDAVLPALLDDRWCSSRGARLLREVKVGQHDVPALVQEDVLRLQVAVDVAV